MREFIQFENLDVEIWRRPRQRRMYLTVREDGRVRVTCNRGQSRRSVLAFVGENLEFIASRRPGPAREHLSGEGFLYFGRKIRLEVIWTWDARARVAQTGDRLELFAPVGGHAADRAEALHAFFRERGRLHLLARVPELVRATGLRPTAVAIRGQRTRWGSCTARGQVSLNWKLVGAPPAVIDYVILHELAHLEQMNHSPKFWAVVERFDPDWRESRAWLRRFERELNEQFAQRHRPAT